MPACICINLSNTESKVVSGRITVQYSRYTVHTDPYQPLRLVFDINNRLSVRGVYSQKDKGALQPSLLSLRGKSVTKAYSRAAVQQKSTEVLSYNLMCVHAYVFSSSYCHRSVPP